MPENGARNAALMAVEILALSDSALAEKYVVFRQKQHDDVVATDKKIQEIGWEKFLN